MSLNWAVVKIFGLLVGITHLVVIALLSFALYAKSDPETAGRIIGSFNWMKLLNPSFEMILYPTHSKTRNPWCEMMRKLSVTLSRKFCHSKGMVWRKNARIAAANWGWVS